MLFVGFRVWCFPLGCWVALPHSRFDGPNHCGFFVFGMFSAFSGTSPGLSLLHQQAALKLAGEFTAEGLETLCGVQDRREFSIFAGQSFLRHWHIERCSRVLTALGFSHARWLFSATVVLRDSSSFFGSSMVFLQLLRSQEEDT